MINGGLLFLFVIYSLIANSHCNWGSRGHGLGFGPGGFNSGYGHHNNGFGYGSGICAGARRQQGMGGHNVPQQAPQQIYYPAFNGYNNNPGFYYEPVRPTSDNFDFRTNLPPPRTTAAPVPVDCHQPTERDTNIFIQTCIYPHDTTQVSCTSRGSGNVPTGTTSITSCKSPRYYNENGDLILEICKDGKWHGDGKTLTCKSHAPIVYHPPPSQDPVVKYVHNPHQLTTAAPSYLNNNWKENESSNVPQITPANDNSAIYYPPWPYPTTSTTPSTTTTSTTTTTTTPTTTFTTTTTTTGRPYYQGNIDWRNYEQNWQQNLPQLEYNNSYGDKNAGTPSPVNYNLVNPGRCPALSLKPGMILECLSKTERSSGSGYVLSVTGCQEPQVTGTEATYKCQMYYEPIGGLTTQYRKCKENGQWTGNDDEFGCKLECGKSNPAGRLPLITFGEMTILGQWPWHAALFVRDRGDMTNACGGTLITHKAVLTAAHCTTLFLSSILRDLDDIRVDLGRYNRVKDDSYVQKFEVEKIVNHPAYNPFIFESDISIIILKQSAKIGFHVRPICYPKNQNAAFDELQLADGSVATVVGWGLDETGESPDELRAAKLKVIGYRECIESFQEADTGALLAKSTTFCAGNNNGTNVCRGDSGSGAFFPVKTSSGSTKWYLQGIVSLGINVSADDKKCDPEKVSIFTRVSPFADWVVRVLSENDAL